MSFLFSELVYRPIYNLLIFIYNVIPANDFGIAIIIVTIAIKLALIPLSRKQIESQKKMQELQPKIKEVQEKYKNDKEKQSRAIMELYKQNKANPFSGCLPLILQLVFLIAIYRVLFNISNEGSITNGSLYAFVSNPGQINQSFLGLVNLATAASFQIFSLDNIFHLVLIFGAAIAQFFQTKMLMAKNKEKEKKENKSQPDLAQTMTKQMLYFAPLMTLFIGFKLPAGLALYWLVSTIFMIIQQYLIVKKEKKEKQK